MTNKCSSLILRLIVTVLLSVVVAIAFLFLPFAHIITFAGFLVLIWISCWSFSRYFVEFVFLKNDITSPTNKAVLVTGCDSGFGKLTAIKLNNLGYHVFACCYSTDTVGYNELMNLSKTSKNKLDLIILDVTLDQSVDDAFELVKKKLDHNEKLWACVNNAGLGGYQGWNWEEKPVDFYKKLIAVNTIGMVRMTHKFTPLLIDCSNSRFVFLSSYAGRFSFTGMSAYCMSKHSCRVFGNCLRRELDHLNVKSIIIEPTMYKTEMTNPQSSLRSFESSWESTDPQLRDRIGLDFYNNMRNGLIALLDSTREDVDEVVDTIVKSVVLNDPYPFYRVANIYQKLSFYSTEYWPEEMHDLLFTGAVNQFMLKLFKLSNQKIFQRNIKTATPPNHSNV